VVVQRALGQMDLTLILLRKNWNVLGVDFIKAFLLFFESGYIPRGCNASFITLIPKRECPASLNEFGPISLMSCVYKVISKIMANRIKKVLPNVIDIHHSGVSWR